MIFAIYLNRIGKRTEAIDQLHQAQKLLPESANIHYNLGLIFRELGDFENSLAHAHKAYALGFQLPGLRNRLKQANEWREPLPKN
jgi:tetratricopeptide (TPR) repeat protein